MIAATLPFASGSITRYKLALPELWAAVLINGDRDALEMLPEEDKAALAEVTHQFGWCVDVDNDSYYARFHDAASYGVLPTMCAIYTFVEHHH